MPMQSKQNFFEGQKIFVGIDVHAKQWHVYASPTMSLGVRAVSMPPNASALISYLTNRFPGGIYMSAYEAGFCGFIKHRELIAVGIHNIVFNASDLKKNNKERLRKTDAVDCKAIWENLSKGDLIPIYIPTVQEEEDRELVRGRENCVKDLRRIKQRIAMFLHKLDTKIPDEHIGKQCYWSNLYVQWLGQYSESLEGGNKTKLKMLLSTLLHLQQHIKEYDVQMHKVLIERHKEMSELLPTIPGIGKLTTAKLCLELMNFSRFANDRHLAGYIGLVPDCHASDQRETIMGTSVRRNKILRAALIEAAWSAISKDPALGSAYAKGRNRGQHPNVAITAIARKLVTRIFYDAVTKERCRGKSVGKPEGAISRPESRSGR